MDNKQLWTNTDIITFLDRQTSNSPIRRNGVKVGKWLVVGGTEDVAWIYKLHDGKHLVDVAFKEFADAIKLAKWLDSAFGEFFPIWVEYPDADIVSMAKWSIRDGIAVYETLSSLSGIVSAQEVQQAYHGALKNVSKWTRLTR